MVITINKEQTKLLKMFADECKAIRAWYSQTQKNKMLAYNVALAMDTLATDGLSRDAKKYWVQFQVEALKELRQFTDTKERKKLIDEQLREINRQKDSWAYVNI